MLTLTELFEMQQTFNERANLNDQKFADGFRGDPARKTGEREKLLIEAGHWIDDLLKAMASEMEELRNCTYWKHWSQEAQRGERYKVKDVEAARREVIDMLHFWISLAQVLGMTPEMVSSMYSSKLAKNIRRQDDGYNIEVKDLAWKLRKTYPNHCPIPYPTNVESLEDMPDEAAAYYLRWAEAEIEGSQQNDGCSFPSLQGTGCKLCGQPDCGVRRYASTLSFPETRENKHFNQG